MYILKRQVNLYYTYHKMIYVRRNDFCNVATANVMISIKQEM
jgi:hypothetical protein